MLKNPRKINILLFSLVTIISFQLIHAPSSLPFDEPFNNAANWGGTGLMEIPNARVLDDGVIRIGIADAEPYRWVGGGMGIFPGLEFTGRLTQLKGISTELGPQYGRYKDKAFDMKYQILPESKWFPALAIGLQDFHGTRL
ncbi:MAG: YjbH domain-containing protein, partial [Pseudomonadota bacterium]